MDTNAMMTATPDETVTTLVDIEPAINSENWLAPEHLPFAKKGGKGGGNSGKAGKGGKSPNRVKRDNQGDNQDDRKDKNFRKCFHYQWRGHITDNYLSKQRGNPPKAANTAAKASADTPSTLTTSIENSWMVASSNASSSDWFMDC